MKILMVLVMGLLGLLWLWRQTNQTGGYEFTYLEPLPQRSEARPGVVYKGESVPIYGHGVPLKHEHRLTLAVEDPLLITQNSGLACSLSCCPSPYSCDKGCLCGNQETIKMNLKKQ
jgi:hypothetical protein